MNDLEEHMPVKLWNNMTKKGLTNLDICIIYCPKILDSQKQTKPRIQYKSHEPHGYLLLSNSGSDGFEVWPCKKNKILELECHPVSKASCSFLRVCSTLLCDHLPIHTHHFHFGPHFEAKPNRFPVACEVLRFTCEPRLGDGFIVLRWYFTSWLFGQRLTPTGKCVKCFLELLLYWLVSSAKWWTSYHCALLRIMPHTEMFSSTCSTFLIHQEPPESEFQAFKNPYIIYIQNMTQIWAV